MKQIFKGLMYRIKMIKNNMIVETSGMNLREWTNWAAY